MALTPVTIPLTFAGGVDTKTDSKSVAPTQLTALENGQFAKGTTIVKRTGYDALTKDVDDGTTYGSPRALAGRGPELCLFDEAALFSYRESQGIWSRVGPAASIVHTERAIAATGTDQSAPDMATVDGVTVAAWEDSRGGVWWCVVEQASGRVLRAAEQISVSGISPRVVHVGAGIHIYVADATGGQILCYPVNAADYAAAPVAVVIASDLSTSTPCYDAVRHDASVGEYPALIAWQTSALTVRIGFVDAAGTFGGVGTTATWGVAVEAPIAVAWTPSTTWSAAAVAYTHVDGAGDLYVNVLNASAVTASLDDDFVCSPVGAAALARVAMGFDGDGAIVVAAENSATLPQNHSVRIVTRTLAGGTAASPATLRGHGLVSRAFSDASGVCFVVAHEVPFFPYAALLRVDVGDPATDPVIATCIGRLVVGSCDGLPTRAHLATVEQDADASRVWRAPLLARQQVDAAADGAQFTETGLQVVTLDFAAVDAYQTAEFGRDLIVAGACPLRYDGDTISELGFHTAPDGTIAATESTAHNTNQMASSSTYLYQINYEERDAAGEIHPGPMSTPILVTLSAAGTGVTFAIPTYRLTAKRRVSIGVWRSAANDTTGEPLLYRVTSLDPSATGSNGYLVNDTTVDTVTLLDELPDALLVLRERAYTNAGVLSNDPVGLGHIIHAGKDRLFFSDPTDATLIRYSQTRRTGYGPEVSADLPAQYVGAPVVAIGTLDGAVLAFSSSSVRYFGGTGPLANPDAAPQIGFSATEVVTGDVGCASARSLAVTPDRVLFKSDRGLYQIDRSRQVGYVGAPVEGYNAQDVTSADPVPGKTQILFLTDSGSTLLYDYFFGQWSTYTNHEGLDAAVVSNTYHYIRAGAADLQVYRSNPDSYLDDTSEIRLHLETAWIKLAGYHQALQKIWHALFLGTYKSPHLLRVRFATDYRDGWDEPYDLDVDANYALDPYGGGVYGAGVYGGTTDSLYQRRVHVGAKCQAIRVSVEDVTSGTPLGASFELTELLLDGGMLKPTASMGNARSH